MQTWTFEVRRRESCSSICETSRKCKNFHQDSESVEASVNRLSNFGSLEETIDTVRLQRKVHGKYFIWGTIRYNHARALQQTLSNLWYACPSARHTSGIISSPSNCSVNISRRMAENKSSVQLTITLLEWIGTVAGDMRAVWHQWTQCLR